MAGGGGVGQAVEGVFKGDASANSITFWNHCTILMHL